MQPTATRTLLDTQVIHAGSTRIGGAVVLPIFQSSVFERSGADSAGYDIGPYPRLSNLPNHDVLGKRLAAIEDTATWSPEP